MCSAEIRWLLACLLKLKSKERIFKKVERKLEAKFVERKEASESGDTHTHTTLLKFNHHHMMQNVTHKKRAKLYATFSRLFHWVYTSQLSH